MAEQVGVKAPVQLSVCRHSREPISSYGGAYTWNGDEDDLLVTPLLGCIVGHRGTAGRESLLLLSPWDVPIKILSLVSLKPLPQLHYLTNQYCLAQLQVQHA